jgi:hypothetical protein
LWAGRKNLAEVKTVKPKIRDLAMLKTTYGKFQWFCLLAPAFLTIPYIPLPWWSLAGIYAAWFGIASILMDIKGLLLWPKEARMELDPGFKDRIEN